MTYSKNSSMVRNSRARKGTISSLQHHAWLPAPAAFPPFSQHPHFHATEIWGQKLGKNCAVQGLADYRSKATRSAAHPSPPPGTFGKGKEDAPNQRLFCLHGSSASLPGCASYFKVIAPPGKLTKVNLKVEDKVIHVWVCPTHSLCSHLASVYAGVQLDTNLSWAGGSTPNENRSPDRKKGLHINTATNLPF